MSSAAFSEHNDLTQFGQLIENLAKAEVEFIVVGGVAGILVGTGLFTQDLDVLFKVSDENIERLLRFLHELDAVYRDPLHRRIQPTVDKLQTFRLNLFETKLGMFDAFPKLSDRWTYEDMLPRSSEYSYGDIEFRALKVDALIETKEAAGRPKDHFALLHLKRIQEMNSHPEELQQMLDLLDAQEAEAEAD